MMSLLSKIMSLLTALFLTDSRLALALLSTAPAFLQSKSFWDIWDLSDSFRVALSFQWVPGHAGLPGNELADSIAKTGATLPFTHVTCPLAPTIAKIRHTRYSFWRRNLFHNSLSCHISVSAENWPFTVSSAVNCSDFAGHGHTAFSCSLTFARKNKRENSSCSVCGHPLLEQTHLLLN